MTARICPRPPDCALYDQRLTYGQDEPLRRAILTEPRKNNDLAALVRGDINRQGKRPPVLAEPAPVLLSRKGGSHAEPA